MSSSKPRNQKQHAAPVSDPRFARVQTDPRFLKPKRDDLKVTLDERFSSLLQQDGKGGSKKQKGKGQKLDRYGRPVKGGKEREQLKQIYKLADDEEDGDEEDGEEKSFLDYARGEGMLESSGDEDDSDSENEDTDSTAATDSEDDGEVVIGSRQEVHKAKKLQSQLEEESDSEEDPEGIDEDGALEERLNPEAFAALDAQAERIVNAEAAESALPSTSAAASSTKEKRKKRRSGDEEGDDDDGVPRGKDTSRLAVVNLDWDHIRSKDLYKVFSSIVNPFASSSSVAVSRNTSINGKGRSREAAAMQVTRGRCIRVRVYPSDFGRERMSKEDIEGPPKEIFKADDAAASGSVKPATDSADTGKSKKKRKGKGKKRADEDDEDDQDDQLFQVDEGGEFDEEQLRKYQLERLRYYYAIAEFDSAASARRVYDEIDGTEMEATANIFDLRFVPEGMEFPGYEGNLSDPSKNDGWRDEATEEEMQGSSYKGVDFKTDALRHSKVKLTWDADDPERAKIMRQSRQALAKGELRDDDFKAYLASDQSDDGEDGDDNGELDDDDDGEVKKGSGRLLALLSMADGGSAFDSKGSRRGGKANKRKDEEDGEMQITFLPGLSEAAAKRVAGEGKEDEETTLDRYKRREKEKKLAKREARLKKLRGEDSTSDGEEESVTEPATEDGKRNITFDDPFFASGDDEDIDFDAALEEELASEAKSKSKSKDSKKGGDKKSATALSTKPEQTKALIGDDDAAPAEGVGHFDMKDILRKEKGENKKSSRFEKRKEKKAAKLAAARGGDIKEEALQEDFKVNPADARFKAMFDDHSFAIDPSHKSFLKTKAMEEILDVKRKVAENRSNEAPPGKDETPDLLSLARKLKKRSGESGQRTGSKKQRVA